MFVFLRVFLFLVITPVFLQARIGEILEEIQARNGHGKELGDLHLFTSGDYDITVSFEDSRSVMEVFTTHPNVDGVCRPLLIDDVLKLIESEGEGKTWLRVASQEVATLWIRADGLVFARFDPNSNTLTFRPKGALPPRNKKKDDKSKNSNSTESSKSNKQSKPQESK